MRFSRTRLLVIGLAFSLMWLSATAAEKEEKDQPVKIEPRADEVLRKVSDFHLKVRSLSLKEMFSMTVHAPGTRRELWSKYDIQLQRPNQAAVRLKDGAGVTVISDGHDLYTYIPSMEKYTRTDAPRTLAAFFHENALELVNRSMGNMFFLDHLMKDDPYRALTEGMESVAYVGREKTGDIPSDHLKFVEEDMDIDVWFAAGDEPVVLRVAPDLSRLIHSAQEVAPELKNTRIEIAIQFTDWKVDQPLGEKAFAFDAPRKAEQVASLFDEEPAEKRNGLVGKPAPNEPLELSDGGKLDLKANKGKVVVLTFWASWCAPCEKSLPALNKIAQKYGNQDVVVYAVNQNEDQQTVRDFLKEHGLKFNVAFDKESKLAIACGVRGIPAMVVIGKDGTVQAVHSGLLSDTEGTLSAELDELLQGGQLTRKNQGSKLFETGTDRKPDMR